jgi:WD40 repeat protein
MQTAFSIYRRDYKKYLIDIIIEVDKSKAYYFESKKYLKSQEILEKKENGNLLIKYKITQEMEIEELIKRWIPFVKVISGSDYNTIKIWDLKNGECIYTIDNLCDTCDIFINKNGYFKASDENIEKYIRVSEAPLTQRKLTSEEINHFRIKDNIL